MAAGDGLAADVAAAILDGTAIDWASAESSAEGAERPLLDQLRVLAAVADVYRDRPDTIEQWGHLRVLDRIGRGAFGEVYRAWDTRLDREVALKLLARSTSDGDARGTAIIEEGRLLARVRHPNVVTIHGADCIDDRIGLWMEFVKGRTLQQALEQGSAFDAAEVVKIGVELCRAIAAVHGAGLVHRDIKPHNVMLADEGRVVLMDFGTGREVGDRSAAGLAGTPLYLAPELLYGHEPTVQSDIYSAGVVLYHLLTKSYPIEATSLSELRERHRQGQPRAVRARRPDVPSRLAAVIDRAIDPHPEGRYQKAEDLADGLAALAARRGVRRVVWPVAIAAGLMLAVGIAWAIRDRQTRPGNALTDQDVLVIADFDNGTGDTVFDAALRQALEFQVDESRFLKAMDDAQVRQALQLSGRSPDARVTGQLARDICVRERKKATLEGSIARLGSAYLLGLHAINCQTGETLAREQAQAADKEHVVGALASVMTAMRVRLGESLPAIPRDDRPYAHGVTTTSLEALQAFYLGDAEWIGKFDARASIRFYERAVELDPDFALAWTVLSLRYGDTGDMDRAKVAAARGYSLIDRVSQRERLLITAQYHLLAGDLDKAIEVHEVLVRMYPRDAIFHDNLANLYLRSGAAERALVEAREGMRLGPKMVRPYLIGVSTALALNRVDDAKAIVDKAAKENLDNPFLHSARLHIAFAEGDNATEQAETEWFRGKDDPEALRVQANHMAALGRHRRVAELYDAAAKLAAQRKSAPGPAQFLMAKAMTDALIGRCPRTPIAKAPTPAIVSALCGDSTAVKAVAHAPALGPWNAVDDYLKAHLLLAQGRASEAVAAFEEMINRKVTNWGPEYPAAHLGLARAAVAAGDTGKARKAYEGLFALWKDADPGIPLLVTARKEFASLR